MITTDLFWAVAPAWENAFANNQFANSNKPAFELPKVEHVNAINNYTQNELRWLGIDTTEAPGGLVAVIPVQGVLSANWSYDGTNTTWVAEQLKIADENKLIKAVVLKFNSPGGTVNGMLNFGAAIKNTKKPVVGFGESVVASAAYLGFSQCQECWIESATTTVVGSIGTITRMVSFSEQLKQQGVDVRVIRSPDDKALGDQSEPINDGAVAEMQALVDAMGKDMKKVIRAKRPQIAEAISAKVFFGNDAIKAGLADKVGSLEQAIKRADYLGRMAAVN